MFAGAAFDLSACNKKADPETQSKTQKTKRVAATSQKPKHSVPDTFKVALGKVFEGYTRTQSALAKDDLLKSSQAFSTMHALLHMMPKDGLDSSAKVDWVSTDEKIIAVLHPMATAVDFIGAQFMEFSEIMVETIGKYGIAADAPVFKFHCPIAKNNQGADWLQNDSVLANP